MTTTRNDPLITLFLWAGALIAGLIGISITCIVSYEGHRYLHRHDRQTEPSFVREFSQVYADLRVVRAELARHRQALDYLHWPEVRTKLILDAATAHRRLHATGCTDHCASIIEGAAASSLTTRPAWPWGASSVEVTTEP